MAATHTGSASSNGFVKLVTAIRTLHNAFAESWKWKDKGQPKSSRQHTKTICFARIYQPPLKKKYNPITVYCTSSALLYGHITFPVFVHYQRNGLTFCHRVTTSAWHHIICVQTLQKKGRKKQLAKLTGCLIGEKFCSSSKYPKIPNHSNKLKLLKRSH